MLHSTSVFWLKCVKAVIDCGTLLIGWPLQKCLDKAEKDKYKLVALQAAGAFTRAWLHAKCVLEFNCFRTWTTIKEFPFCKQLQYVSISWFKRPKDKNISEKILPSVLTAIQTQGFRGCKIWSSRYRKIALLFLFLFYYQSDVEYALETIHLIPYIAVFAPVSIFLLTFIENLHSLQSLHLGSCEAWPFCNKLSNTPGSFTIWKKQYFPPAAPLLGLT